MTAEEIHDKASDCRLVPPKNRQSVAQQFVRVWKKLFSFYFFLRQNPLLRFFFHPSWRKGFLLEVKKIKINFKGNIALKKKKKKKKIKWRSIGALLSSSWLVHLSFSYFPPRNFSLVWVELVHPRLLERTSSSSGISQLASFFRESALVGVSAGKRRRGRGVRRREKCWIGDNLATTLVHNSILLLLALLRSKDDASSSSLLFFVPLLLLLLLLLEAVRV